MSCLVERAIAFYLQYPEKVEEVEASVHGKTHQVHICPECDAAIAMREGKMVSLKKQPSVLTEELPLEVRSVDAPDKSQGEEQLVPC
jgi:ABC-type cobalamin/Fe3+-siderophores transport system ATPase subunit